MMDVPNDNAIAKSVEALNLARKTCDVLDPN